MSTVLWKAASFLFIMALGVLLRKAHIFGEEDYKILVKIVLNITLPAAIIANFATIRIDTSMLVIIAFGFFCNVFMLGLGWLLTRKAQNSSKALYMLNLSGYNIGAFVIPYAQSFFGPLGVVTACMFDAGNSIMCTGVAYASTCAAVGNNGQRIGVKDIVLKLLTSMPFMSYTIMLIFTFTGLQLPQIAFDFIAPIAQANTFAAMLMIGLMFRIDVKGGATKKAVSIVALRMLFATGFACFVYFCLPFSLEVRQALSIVAFAPISVASTPFAVRCGADSGLAGFTNSLSIAASVIALTGIMIGFGCA
ncbi:MAG: AEC family transporter [Oscillospiraceae bacterium]|nr:AEC family transporter [Oscillospiraceae bacterium]